MKTYNKESGTFTIWAIGLCLTLFMLGGISVDVWRAFDARRELNDMADTAARNGASEINVFERQVNSKTVLDPTLAKKASQDSLDENAAINGVDITDSQVDVDTAQNEVTVEVHSKFSFFLLGFIPGASDSDMGARASARPYEGQ